MLAGWILAAALAGPPAAAATGEQMACDVGPVARNYGASEWQVYSCVDGRSIVVLANEGSRAHPFYFMLTPEAQGVNLYGEGTGDNEATRAAYKDLEKLTSEDVAALVAETRAVARQH